ncbi:50S ribosomal protein L5 [Patescibacteria group bacterium]|nr:50S ribosomal protein L5 [Patescibacteria group bacterium]MBU1890343.1 50S ribosomal protein L5 [Patescibacteria group bacterium]
MNQLEKKFIDTIIPEMRKRFNIKNDLAVPKLVKIVVNVGTGANDDKQRAMIEKTLSRITGQKPRVNKAKVSVSSFKLRKGMPIGASVTLRGKRMYDFIDKLVNVTLPRVRDFRGISKKILDGQGNLNIGFKEHTIFPEIMPDEIEIVHGLEVAIVTSTKNNEQALELFELLGFPFRKEETNG